MLKILDLFAGTQSVKKALTKKYRISKWLMLYGKWIGYDKHGKAIIEYIGIDIYSPEESNTILDLTQDNVIKALIKVLPKGWIPDFIWASPVCNKFSSACAYKGGNLFFVVDKDKQEIKVRKEWNDENNRRYTIENCKKNKDRYIAEANLALKMHKNTIEIIKHFNCNFVIENPAYASSRYLYKEYERNITNYCMYGFDYKKTTAIYSNKKIELLQCSHREKHARTMSGKIQHIKTYAEKSSVPPLLIETILHQSLGENNAK